jgi:hypothetical protein
MVEHESERLKPELEFPEAVMQGAWKDLVPAWLL